MLRFFRRKCIVLNGWSKRPTNNSNFGTYANQSVRNWASSSNEATITAEAELAGSSTTVEQPRRHASSLKRKLTHQGLPYISFSNLESAVRQEIMRSAAERQFMLESLPRFSKILNGLRPGELTVFTGPTGCGKTTLLSQMSLDYCTQGLTVLWGSFEIRNTRLAQVMLQQAAQSPLTDGDKIAEDRFIQAASALRAAPMHFMNLFGSTGLGVVLDAMECAMQPGGIKPHLVILDNLQFMLSGQATNSLDKWELMERAISELRNFCNTYPVHVILVVHPRKELDDTSLGLASVSGTAKATQEADNVIILQKLGERRYIDVRKNRYHGDLGRVQIGYVPESRMVFEIKEEAGGNNSPEDEE